MMRACLVGLVIFGVAGCKARDPAQVASAPTASAAPAPGPKDMGEEINPRLLRRFQPVADGTAAFRPSKEKIALGRALFHDKRLSKNQEIACTSCHSLEHFGTDGQKTSMGVGGQLGGRNTPSVFNTATHIAQFWDGRANSVEQQATGPIMNPIEMAMPSEKAVVAVLEAIPGYVLMFKEAFPGESKPISLKNVGEAIGAFERGLVTVSRWDKFIAGDPSALTSEEKHGLRVFLDAGCMTCHTGPQVGGSMFQKVGSVIPWPNQKDLGRVAVTKSPADQMVFKVPSLKNIAKTAPYFHDGSAGDLETAIRRMGHHQLGIELATDEVKAIAAWMLSMTGQVDPTYIAAPELPPTSGKNVRRL